MKVKFVPQDIELEIESNQSVMELAHKNGLPVKSVCNGMPSCSECRVRVIEGEHNVLPPSQKELSLIGTGYFLDQRRLSCQLQCFGDITVDLSEQIEKEKLSSQRRPQGTLKKDIAEESLAVTGNLIEQEHALIKETEAEPDRKGESKSADGFYSDLNKDKGDGKKKNRPRGNKNRNRNRGNRTGNRSRSRGRHRPKQGGGSGSGSKS